MRLCKGTRDLHCEDCFLATCFDIFGSLNHCYCSSFPVYFHLHIFIRQPRCLLINLCNIGLSLASETDDFRIIASLSLVYDDCVDVLQTA